MRVFKNFADYRTEPEKRKIYDFICIVFVILLPISLRLLSPIEANNGGKASLWPLGLFIIVAIISIISAMRLEYRFKPTIKEIARVKFGFDFHSKTARLVRIVSALAVASLFYAIIKG